jgi:hypothetical protein
VPLACQAGGFERGPAILGHGDEFAVQHEGSGGQQGECAHDVRGPVTDVVAQARENDDVRVGLARLDAPAVELHLMSPLGAEWRSRTQHRRSRRDESWDRLLQSGLGGPVGLCNPYNPPLTQGY